MDDAALRELLSPYMYNLHECLGLRCALEISRAGCCNSFTFDYRSEHANAFLLYPNVREEP